MSLKSSRNNRLNKTMNVILDHDNYQLFKSICDDKGLKMGRVLGEFVERFNSDNMKDQQAS